MGAPKGHKKWGGRQKGTPNQKALPLMEKAQALGVDPFEILLLFAKGDWEGLGYPAATRTMFSKSGQPYEIDIIQPDHRLKAAGEACQYLHAKRKAIEVSDDRDPGEDPLDDYSDDELEAL